MCIRDRPTSKLEVGSSGDAPTEAVREAFDAADANRNGTLDERELGQALKQLGMETTPDEAAEIMRKYDVSRNGRLELGEFNVLVRELHAFNTQEAQKAFLRVEPQLPLRLSLSARPSVPSGAYMSAASEPSAEVAYAQVNVASGRDLKADLPLLSTEDGGVMGVVSVTIRAAASIRPFLDVRRAFTRMDKDGNGSISINEAMPAIKALGVLGESAAVDAFNRANRTADGKLTLEQFDKLYRLVGGFDEGTGRGGAGRTSPYSDPYALSTRDINETAMRKNAESAYARLDYASAQVVADSSTAVLFSKAVPLKALEPERPYSFWVDSHCRLEILEIAIHPEVDKGVRHTVMMSARDQDGRVKVEKAVLFDSGAYFNVESPNGNRSTSVKLSLIHI